MSDTTPAIKDDPLYQLLRAGQHEQVPHAGAMHLDSQVIAFRVRGGEPREPADSSTAVLELRGRKHVVRLGNTSPSGAMVIFNLMPHIGEEATLHLLGRGPVATTLTVTVPLIRSGIFAGAALVFLSAMKELPTAILLRPPGFDTLPVRIWTQIRFGVRPTINAIGSFMLVISLLAKPEFATAHNLHIANHQDEIRLG